MSAVNISGANSSRADVSSVDIRRASMMPLPFVLYQVLCDGAYNGTANSAQEAVAGLLAKKKATGAATNGAQEATVRLVHWRSVRIIVWRVRIRRLWSELVVI